MNKHKLSKPPSQKGLGLGLKFVILLVTISSLALGVGAIIDFNLQHKKSLENLNEKTKLLGRLASQISIEPLLSYDFPTLNRTMEDLHEQKDLVYAIILSPNNENMTSYVMEENNHIQDAKKITEKNSLVSLIENINKSSNIISMTFPINFNNQILGNVVLGVSTERMENSLIDMLIQRIIISAAIIAILSICIYIMYRQLTLKPIKNLLAGSLRISSGDLAQQVTKYSNDELGHLTNSFNFMMIRLKDANEQKDHYLEELTEARDKLETKVAERTQALTKTNNALTQEINQRRLIEEELRNINHELKAAQNQLLQSEKMASIGQLAAGVAHEINNPVGYINSNICSLQDYIDSLIKMLDVYAKSESSISQHSDVIDEINAVKKEIDLLYLKDDIQDLIRESLEGVTRVKQIVQDLKDYSHIDEAEWQLADLHKGIDSTLNIVRNEIKYKADVIKDYGDLPKIECIPSQLNQIFTNLLINASHAIKDRGKITIRTEQKDDAVILEFSDTGNGVKQENIKRIFEPFFTTKPVGQGTGLGLSLSYGIIQKHHGKIEVESEIGKGTTFRIWLPIQQPITQEEEQLKPV